MKFRWKYGEGRRFAVRDIIGICILCAIFVFVFYDKNFIEAAGPEKTYDKIGRTVKVKIAVDRQFLALNGSSEKTASEIFLTLKGASEIFERDFGINFVICDFAVWKDEEKTASFMKFREEFAGAPCDIVVLFSGRQIDDDDATMGAAFGSKIILREKSLNFASEQGQAKILAHEFGHLFWAIHRDGGLMRDYDANLAEEKWDALNWRLIIFNKYKNFRKYNFLPKKLRP